MAQVSLRIKKLKSSELGAVQKHNEREEIPTHANPNPTHNNKRLIGKNTLSNLVLNRIEKSGATISRGKQNESTVAVEIVLSASPEYFRENAEDWGSFDVKKTNEWISSSTQFLKKKFGDNLVCVDLHLDEATPHIHAIVTPLVVTQQSKRRTKKQIKENIAPELIQKTKLNASKLFNKEALIQLQTDAAEAVSHLEIERGKRGSSSSHTTLKDFYRSINKTNFKSSTYPKLKINSINRDVPINPLKLSRFIDRTNDKIEHVNKIITQHQKDFDVEQSKVIRTFDEMQTKLDYLESEKNKLTDLNNSLNSKLKIISNSDRGALQAQVAELKGNLSKMKSVIDDYPKVIEQNRNLTKSLYEKIESENELRSFLSNKNILDEYLSSKTDKNRTESRTEPNSAKNQSNFKSNLRPR